ncbi:class I SAM-dependent methyltransferase [bacterium]|nr:class I SAM-dependent methyltransferase [bacterium]
MRIDQNSLKLDAHAAQTFLERMELFYELFPYPNRPIFLKPDAKGSVETHAGYSMLLATRGHSLSAQELADVHLRDARHVFSHSKRIALVGCGTDEPLLFRILHPHNPIVGIDLSQRSLLRADRKIRWHNLKPVTLVHGEATAALREQGMFDHIQCFGVLHHQPRPQTLLKTMADSLNPGGTLRLMIYSSNGRRLERGLQRRFETLWNHLMPQADVNADSLQETLPSKAKLRINLASLRLLLWRLGLPFFAKRSVAGRFKYVGLSRARVADAFMHPSDHPLSLRATLRWAAEAGLTLVSHKGKSYDLGWLNSHGSPQTPIQALVSEEERGNISTNLILVFKKVGSL